MHDRRVVRGNTWALRRIAQEQYKLETLKGREEMRKKRNLVRQQVESKLRNSKSLLHSSKEHTERELATVEEQDVLNSTELQPLNHEFSVMVASSVQTEDENDTDLHQSTIESESQTTTVRSSDAQSQTSQDFDDTVEPILDILVSSVIEEATREMEDEEKLRKISAEKESESRARVIDKTRIEQLETDVRSSREEKEALMAELEKLKNAETKMAVRQVATEFLQDLMPNAIERLTSSGFLQEKKSIGVDTSELHKEIQMQKQVKKEVEGDFLPWLFCAANRTAQHDHMQLLLSDETKLDNRLQDLLTECLFTVFNCPDSHCREDARKTLENHLKHMKNSL